MLNIFSCVSWPSICLLWRTVCVALLPIFAWGCLVFFFFFFFLINPLSVDPLAKIFSHSVGCLLIFPTCLLLVLLPLLLVSNPKTYHQDLCQGVYTYFSF
uniref:Uncharacterized protein n=1 Tax=Sus scrofa TaxID=9823 RepID=A0A8W4F857_PIG